MSQSHGTASCRRPDTQSRPLLRAPTLETLRARVANHSAARNGGHTEYAVAVTETRTGAWAAGEADKRTLGGHAMANFWSVQRRFRNFWQLRERVPALRRLPLPRRWPRQPPDERMLQLDTFVQDALRQAPPDEPRVAAFFEADTDSVLARELRAGHISRD